MPGPGARERPTPSEQSGQFTRPKIPAKLFPKTFSRLFQQVNRDRDILLSPRPRSSKSSETGASDGGQKARGGFGRFPLRQRGACLPPQKPSNATTAHYAAALFTGLNYEIILRRLLPSALIRFLL